MLRGQVVGLSSRGHKAWAWLQLNLDPKERGWVSQDLSTTAIWVSLTEGQLKSNWAVSFIALGGVTYSPTEKTRNLLEKCHNSSINFACYNINAATLTNWQTGSLMEIWKSSTIQLPSWTITNYTTHTENRLLALQSGAVRRGTNSKHCSQRFAPHTRNRPLIAFEHLSLNIYKSILASQWQYVTVPGKVDHVRSRRSGQQWATMGNNGSNGQQWTTIDNNG